MNEPGEQSAAPTLVVDLDGTLLRGDLLHETFWSAAGKDWKQVLRAVAALGEGRAALKRHLAAATSLGPAVSVKTSPSSTSRPATCSRTDTDCWRCMIATCTCAAGRDVNDWLVQRREALDWLRHSRCPQAAAQQKARDARRCAFRNAFVMHGLRRRGVSRDWTVDAIPADATSYIKCNMAVGALASRAENNLRSSVKR
jgi:hypothetical protein